MFAGGHKVGAASSVLGELVGPEPLEEFTRLSLELLSQLNAESRVGPVEIMSINKMER